MKSGWIRRDVVKMMSLHMHTYDTDITWHRAVEGDNYKVLGKVPEEITVIKVTHFQEKKTDKNR